MEIAMKLTGNKAKVVVELILCRTFRGDSGDWWTVTFELEVDDCEIPPDAASDDDTTLWRELLLRRALSKVNLPEDDVIAHAGLYYWQVQADEVEDGGFYAAAGDRVQARFDMKLLDNNYQPVRINAGDLGSVLAVEDGDIQPYLIEWDGKDTINNCDPDEIELMADPSPQDGTSKEAK